MQLFLLVLLHIIFYFCRTLSDHSYSEQTYHAVAKILIIVVVLLVGVAVYFVFIKGQFDIKVMYIQCSVMFKILKEKKIPLANTFNIYITIEPNILKTFFFHLSYLLLIISLWLFLDLLCIHTNAALFKYIVFFRSTVQGKKCINNKWKPPGINKDVC